jgi:hypothetical protein
VSSPQLDELVIYCKNRECGDPIVGSNGEVHYTLREMFYAGSTGIERAVYRCPVCDRERHFTIPIDVVRECR